MPLIEFHILIQLLLLFILFHSVGQYQLLTDLFYFRFVPQHSLMFIAEKRGKKTTNKVEKKERRRQARLVSFHLYLLATNKAKRSGCLAIPQRLYKYYVGLLALGVHYYTSLMYAYRRWTRTRKKERKNEPMMENNTTTIENWFLWSFSSFVGL